MNPMRTMSPWRHSLMSSTCARRRRPYRGVSSQRGSFAHLAEVVTLGQDRRRRAIAERAQADFERGERDRQTRGERDAAEQRLPARHQDRQGEKEDEREQRDA